MKIVLVDPGFGKRSFNTWGQSHWSTIIHHGLCSITASARESGFTDIELIDTRQIKNWEEYDSLVKAKDPQVMGFTMISCDVDMAGEAVRRAKMIKPSVVSIVGGVHPTVATEEVAQNKDYDYIITGEGEISFPELLKKIEKGETSPRIISGIRPGLNQIPYYYRELYDYRVSVSLANYNGVFDPPMVTMLASRGCIYNCSFCAPHATRMFGKGERIRSVDNVLGELEILREKYPFKSLKFYDYSFLTKPEWVNEFCEKYRERGFNQDILCQSTVHSICRHPELLIKLKKVGLKMLLVGFESGSDRVLKILHKAASAELNLKAAKIVRENGIILGGSFMLGVPGETREDARLTAKLVRKMKPHFTSVSFFTPIPGNYLYEKCMKEGISLVEGPEDLVTFAPDKPKIKGVDYEYLKGIAAEIMGTRFGGRLMGKFIRYVYVKTKYHYRLRKILVFLYSKYVQGWGEKILRNRMATDQ